ncbi:uncharacterized protein [Triticum aestivum]|uniref:uncharacterized protein isoform X2 n=1 Tax=Triticum aestivum TaxID=4565 RepID=UPI001D012D02|nr:uncharacterized protein LOC123058530 isoform X2 [Triticum aestivum]
MPTQGEDLIMVIGVLLLLKPTRSPMRTRAGSYMTTRTRREIDPVLHFGIIHFRDAVMDRCSSDGLQRQFAQDCVCLQVHGGRSIQYSMLVSLAVMVPSWTGAAAMYAIVNSPYPSKVAWQMIQVLYGEIMNQRQLYMISRKGAGRPRYWSINKGYRRCFTTI